MWTWHIRTVVYVFRCASLWTPIVILKKYVVVYFIFYLIHICLHLSYHKGHASIIAACNVPCSNGTFEASPCSETHPKVCKGWNCLFGNKSCWLIVCIGHHENLEACDFNFKAWYFVIRWHVDIVHLICKLSLNLQNAQANVQKNTSSVQSALLHMIPCAQVRHVSIIVIVNSIVIIIVDVNNIFNVIYFINVNILQNAEIIAATQNMSTPPVQDHKIVAAKASLKIDLTA